MLRKRVQCSEAVAVRDLARAGVQVDMHNSKTLYIYYEIQDVHLLQDPTFDFTDQITDFEFAKKDLVRCSRSVAERRCSKARRLQGGIIRGGCVGEVAIRREAGQGHKHVEQPSSGAQVGGASEQRSNRRSSGGDQAREPNQIA